MTKIKLEEILKIDFVRKNVLIIGSPASGKTWLIEQIKEVAPYHNYIATDDYIKDNTFKGALYAMMDDIKTFHDDGKLTVVEGVNGYRLLRKGVQEDTYYPDIVIECKTSQKNIEARYEGDEKKLKGVFGMMKGNATILAEYLEFPNKHKPIMYVLNNNYEITEEVKVVPPKESKPKSKKGK